MRSAKHRNKVLRIILFAVIGYLLLAWVINRANYALKNVYSEKIWVHRVNSLEKLKEVQPKFQGVELDIVFEEEGEFDVNHPPAESIEFSLEEYFAAANFGDGYGIWLDAKNLSSNNAEQALFKLTQLCEDYGILRHQIIVESTDPSVLPPFGENGFKTSFYLPQNLNEASDESRVKVLSELNNLMKQYPTDYLSTNRRHYHFLKAEFPDSPILTWSFEYDSGFTVNPFVLFREVKGLFAKFEILSDEQVEVVLFGYEAETGNR